jgi:tetratricopeptide (TPR) repeat protein
MRLVALALCLAATTAGVAAAEPGDWAVTRDPFDKTVVARLKAILAQNPYDRALTHLVAMYRKSRTVAQLVAEYEQDPAWASLVVQARLAELDHRPALPLYERAVAANERDVRGWIAIGDASKPEQARVAYERALALSPPLPLEKAVLRKLAALPGDADRAYARLIELDPRNGRLWVERGDALLLAGKHALAIDSYTAAEPLLRTDPDRRMYALSQRGSAHELLDHPAEAIADYNRVLAESTRNYFQVAMRRKLVKLLDAQSRRAEATAQLEAAAKAAPTDSTILFDLVDRYWGTDKPKLFATLDKLGRTFPKHARVHHRLGEHYMKLRRLDLATREYEVVAKLEPDAENLLLLGDAYWSAGKEAKATATWHRIGRVGTAKAFAILGNVLLEHDLIEDALDAYSKAIAKEPNNPELWRGRGSVYEAAGRLSSALADTDHAVALLGDAPRDVGHAARYQLARILATMRDDDDVEYDVDGRIVDWQTKLAQDSDLMSGYVLAEYFGRSPDDSVVEVLEQLHALVPSDEGVTLDLIRAYRVLLHYDKAIALAKDLARTAPARKEELTKLIAKIEEDSRNNPEPLSWDDDYIGDPEPEIRAARTRARPVDRIREARVRAGVRLGVGTGLRGAAGRALTMGAIGTFGRGPFVLVTRLDWAQRESDMKSESALATSVGVAGRVVTRPSFAVLFGGAPRLQRRLGTLMPDVDRNALAADVTLDVVTRHMPLVVGARFEQGLFERDYPSTLLFELSVELR